MAKRIVGLDIGREYIRAVEVQNADRARPTVTRVGSIALPPDAVRSGEVREVNTVAAAIRKLWSTSGFRSRDVVIGMGNHRVLARDLTVPRMSIAQIRESLPFQVQDMLPVPVAEALLDYYPISEVQGEQGPAINGLLIAAIKESVMANVNAVRGAGLTPVQSDLIPFALVRALTPKGSTGTVVIVDIGGSTTNVIVVTNGVPQFVRMIPAGGHDLTAALASRLELTEEQADYAKRARGLSSMPPSNESERAVSEVIAESSTELITALRNTINFYFNTRPQASVQAIVLTGGGAQLPGLGRTLADTLRIQVVDAAAFNNVEVSNQASKMLGKDAQSMTVALGLALGSVA